MKALLVGSAALFGIAASAPPAPTITDPGEALGGAWYTCPLLGAVFGLQVSTGDAVGSVVTLLNAHERGCLW